MHCNVPLIYTAINYSSEVYLYISMNLSTCCESINSIECNTVIMLYCRKRTNII